MGLFQYDSAGRGRPAWEGTEIWLSPAPRAPGRAVLRGTDLRPIKPSELRPMRQDGLCGIPEADVQLTGQTGRLRQKPGSRFSNISHHRSLAQLVRKDSTR
jgi:hypothetical protein